MLLFEQGFHLYLSILIQLTPCDSPTGPHSKHTTGFALIYVIKLFLG